MNRVIIILVALVFQACVQVQEKVLLEKPKIDKRVELLSIVFRLAERPEYSSKAFQLYTDKIEQHFEEYKNHELIQFAKSIRRVSWDAVMHMATHLDDNLELLSDIIPLEASEANSYRWQKEDVEKFVTLLQKFSKDTKFDDFFKSNADLYAEVVKRFSPIYEQLNLNWYPAFYGKEPSETYLLKIGMGNYDSYGSFVDYNNGGRKAYAIIGVRRVDSSGMPDFEEMFFQRILHEFNHSFVNPLIADNREAFRESGEKIFSVVKDDMAKQGYRAWEIVFMEALVRAAVIKYMKDHDFEQSEIANEIKAQKEEYSFFWIEELVDKLEIYDSQRDRYPTLESYLPKLVEAYKIWAENIQNK